MSANRTALSLSRGLFLRCPACGLGPLYDGYSDQERCTSCGLPFLPATGEFTGALMAAQGLFGLVTAAGAVALYLAGVRSWWLLAWLVFGVAALPLLFYRNVKGLWIGLLHATRGRR